MVKKSCFMFSVILFPIYVGATSFTSNVTGGTVTSNLSMTVKASCSTTVGDVTFGCLLYTSDAADEDCLV